MVNRAVRIGLVEMVTFEQRFIRGEAVSHEYF